MKQNQQKRLRSIVAQRYKKFLIRNHTEFRELEKEGNEKQKKGNEKVG